MRSLRELAAAHGVLTSYYGIDGLTRATPDALLAVLRILGAPVEKLEDADHALREWKEERARRLLPPVTVLRDETHPAAILTHRVEDEGRGTAHLVLEDGSTLEESFELSTLPVAFSRRGLVHRRLPLPRLPLGYHRLTVSLGERWASSHLLSAPGASYRDPELEEKRRFGLFAPLYGLHSRDSLGLGDFSDLRRFSDLVSSHGGDFVATLPLLATFVDEPSPYSPASRRFWNELYGDPRIAPEWETARSLSSGDGFFARLEHLHRAPLVDYPAAAALKRPLLETMSLEALRNRPDALHRFARERPLVIDYARFRAARERGAELLPGADLGHPGVLYHLYGQMLAEEQLAEISRAAAAKGVRFYFDLPIGVHGSGFDTWSEPSLFARGADAGAPPDVVFPDGQSWGFPPLLPDRSRQQGHRHLRECLQHTMRQAGLLRVDHVMGFHRLFWIPAGFEKRDGVYVRYPAEELHAIAAIESVRQRCELVGENLGIVPPAVNRALERHRWRGIYVLQFSLTGDERGPVAPVPSNAVASLNTHDTPTFAGFRRCRDLDERVEAGFLDRARADEICRQRAAAIVVLDAHLGLEAPSPEPSQESLERWHRLLLESEADLVLVNFEDLWLEEESQNVPGRVDLPNWRRKLRHSLSSLPPEVLSALARILRRA